MSYCFRRAYQGEEKIVFTLIEARVDWMDRKGIQQWNTTDYLHEYPLSYYEKNIDRLYVLADQESGQISCAAILLEYDERWQSDQPAFYIHNLVSDLNSGHAGTVFMHMLERFALQRGKRYLRLDSAEDNEKLKEYYKALGFDACGSCIAGDYHGILRQKKLLSIS